MAAAPYERVIVVNALLPSGETVPIDVRIDVSAGPVEVAITEVADNLTVNTNTNGQSTVQNFIDSDGTLLAVQTAFGAPATSGNNELVNGVASKKIRVVGYTIQGKGTVSMHFRSGSTPISMTWDLEAREGAVVSPVMMPLFDTAVNTDLNVNLSDNVGVNVQVWYILVSG